MFYFIIILSFILSISPFADNASLETALARKSLHAQLNPNYIRAVSAYKRLESRMTRKKLRALVTIGILNGVEQTERAMETNLVSTLKELLLDAEAVPTISEIKPKIDKIGKQLARDRNALEILLSALDLATHKKKPKDFKNDMQMRLQYIQQSKNATKQVGNDKDAESSTRKLITALRHSILEHVTGMKLQVEEKIRYTLNYLMNEADEGSVLAKLATNHKIAQRRGGVVTNDWREEPLEIQLIQSILTEGEEGNKDKQEDVINLEELAKRVRAKRIGKQLTTATTTTEAKAGATPIALAKTGMQTILQPTETSVMSATLTTNLGRPVKQEEGSSEFDVSEGGGGGSGLLGVIASLSGGEGGFDVGALVGALTGLVSTLFGPGGLDVEVLLSTATSLISGLLAGNKNFGTVLGQYVGIAFDGFSGGGGAVNNGKFVGNLLGTVVASLSADPEDDDEPPKPFIFLQNVLSSFMEAKNRKASDEDESGERGDNGNTESSAMTGSDSVGFIKRIVSHVVGGAVSLILNAALGASGGASQASSSLFASSSGGHKMNGGAANDYKIW